MQVDAIRRFSRFYTRRVGALRAGLLGSPYPLPEARLIYELGSRGTCSAGDLCRELDLDAGYLSRLLKRFEEQGLLTRRTAPGDGRRQVLALTPGGQAAFTPLNEASRAEVEALLARLPSADRTALVGAMARVRRLLGAHVGVATTGVAGPDPQEGKPAGTVHVAVASSAGTRARMLDLSGDRASVREGTVLGALELVADAIVDLG